MHEHNDKFTCKSLAMRAFYVFARSSAKQIAKVLWI